MVAAIAVAAFAFGSAVLIAEAFEEDPPPHEAEPHAASMP